MKTKVINLVGGPSSGKSVMAARIFAELKSRHCTAEYVQEYVKTLIWQERFDDIDNQFHVSKKQYKWIKILDNKVEYIIVDSPLIVGLFYNRFSTTNVSNVERTERYILSRMEEFDNIYIFLERNPQFPFEIDGRIHTEKESLQIDQKLRELLHEFHLPYKSIKSSAESVNEVVDYIRESNNYN